MRGAAHCLGSAFEVRQRVSLGIFLLYVLADQLLAMGLAKLCGPIDQALGGIDPSTREGGRDQCDAVAGPHGEPDEAPVEREARLRDLYDTVITRLNLDVPPEAIQPIVDHSPLPATDEQTT